LGSDPQPIPAANVMLNAHDFIQRFSIVHAPSETRAKVTRSVWEALSERRGVGCVGEEKNRV
jgi:hypothetical protein